MLASHALPQFAAAFAERLAASRTLLYNIAREDELAYLHAIGTPVADDMNDSTDAAAPVATATSPSPFRLQHHAAIYGQSLVKMIDVQCAPFVRTMEDDLRRLDDLDETLQAEVAALEEQLKHKK